MMTDADHGAGEAAGCPCCNGEIARENGWNADTESRRKHACRCAGRDDGLSVQDVRTLVAEMADAYRGAPDEVLRFKPSDEHGGIYFRGFIPDWTQAEWDIATKAVARGRRVAAQDAEEDGK